jgi:hypothetical protein
MNPSSLFVHQSGATTFSENVKSQAMDAGVSQWRNTQINQHVGNPPPGSGTASFKIEHVKLFVTPVSYTDHTLAADVCLSHRIPPFWRFSAKESVALPPNPRVSMPEYFPVRDHRPICEGCDRRMSLVPPDSVRPGQRYFGHQIFECAKCGKISVIPTSH